MSLNSAANFSSEWMFGMTSLAQVSKLNPVHSPTILLNNLRTEQLKPGDLIMYYMSILTKGETRIEL